MNGLRWKSIKKMGVYDPYAKIKSGKVRITTYIDSDVLIALKNKSASQKEGYQTLMNRVLRKYCKL